jgi:hypothetical protein
MEQAPGIFKYVASSESIAKRYWKRSPGFFYSRAALDREMVSWLGLSVKFWENYSADESAQSRRHRMTKYAVAAVLIGIFTTPALALVTGSYFVGLNTTTHTCSVVTKMEPGMKMMGKYKSHAAAERAMARMKECKG